MLTWMPAPGREVAAMPGRSTGPCKGSAAEPTPPGPGRQSATPSALRAFRLPAHRNRFHAPT